MNAPTQVPPDHVVDSVAYDTSDKPYRGYSVRASYLKAPNEQDAWIEVSRADALVKSFYYPAYRIYNIAAHFSEMVDNEIDESESCNGNERCPHGINRVHVMCTDCDGAERGLR